MPQMKFEHVNGKKVFQAKTFMPVTLETISRFHAQSNALTLLTPPPLIVQIIRDQRISNTEGSVDFTLWFGPFPVRWLARHEPGPVATSFIDRMLIGPMAEWEHQHIFHAVAGSVELIDKLTYRHRPGWQGWITRLMFDGPALRLLFWYRHWRTLKACLQQESPSRHS